MSEFTPQAVEHPDAVAAAQRNRVDVLTAPVQTGAATWCYDRIKRSTSKIRLRASFARRSEFDRNLEFQKLVDLVKADSLLNCAVLEFGWNTSTVTFRNGSVIEFPI